MSLNLQNIEDRVSSARIVLQKSAGQRQHAVVSRVQASALLLAIKHASRQGFNADLRAHVSAIVQDVPFDSADMERVQAALDVPIIDLIRRKQQNYSSSVVMFNDPEVQTLLDLASTSGDRLDVIVHRVAKCGCRCIDEKSAKLLASLWVMLSEPPANLAHMTASSKAAMLKHFKSVLKAVCDRYEKPAEYVLTLPSSPVQFRQAYPSLYREAYLVPGTQQLTHPTGKCPVDLELLIKFDQSYMCRDRGRGTMIANDGATDALQVNCFFSRAS